MRISLLIAVAIMLFACDTRRDIIEDKKMEITINIDWSELQKQPLLASILFYNRDNSSSKIIHHTNFTTTTVMLPVGVYDVLCFNESFGAHENIEFRNVENYHTIEAYAEHFTPNEGYEVAQSGQAIREPSVLAIDRYENLVIERDYSEDYHKEINFKPKSVISTLRLKVNLNGIENLSNINYSSAAISGMAEGLLLASGEPNGTSAINYFYFGPKSYNEGSLTQGSISGLLRCFGPDRPITKSTEQNIATLFLKLRNGTDLLSDQGEPITRDITDGMVYDSNLDLHIDIELGLGVEGDPTITLPFVEDSEGGKETGFDAEIEDWGDEEVTDVPIG